MILLSVEQYYGSQQVNQAPFLADLIMSDEESNKALEPEEISKTSPSMKKGWGDGRGAGRTKLFENTDDFDIYCDTNNDVNYIFHGPELGCSISDMEYDPDTCRITVFTKDGQKLDLGAKIQWLVRPYLAKDQYILVIRTENGQALEGYEVHLRIKDPFIDTTHDKDGLDEGKILN